MWAPDQAPTGPPLTTWSFSPLTAINGSDLATHYINRSCISRTFKNIKVSHLLLLLLLSWDRKISRVLEERKLMEIAEKKDTEIKASNALPAVDYSVDRESDDRDRHSRELKAGLHPLKVSSLIFPIPFLTPLSARLGLGFRNKWPLILDLFTSDRI